MNGKRWKRSTSVCNIGYHLIWCPKYRRKVLVGEVATKTTPTDSSHFIVQQLKGYTSRMLRQEFPSLKSKLPSMWTRSYYCESVGHISEETICKYVEEQKNK